MSELMRVFANTNTVDRLHSTDRLLVVELYALCVWPGEPAPPARACTPPISYDFVGMRIGLKRSGAERAVQRLRERGWVETEADAETGFLVYHLDIARILSDLGTWGAWSTRDAKHCRPPSRKSRDETPRSPRWEGRGPRRPAHRRRPQSMPIEALTARWRSLWPAAPDPTAILARLLGQGASPSDLHRALDSLEGSQLTRPAPEFIADRYERVAYLGRRPDPAEAPSAPPVETPDPPVETPDPPVETPDPPVETPDPPVETPDPPPPTEPPTVDPPTPVPPPPRPDPRPTAAGKRALAAFLAGSATSATPAADVPQARPPDESVTRLTHPGIGEWTTPENGTTSVPAQEREPPPQTKPDNASPRREEL